MISSSTEYGQTKGEVCSRISDGSSASTCQETTSQSPSAHHIPTVEEKHALTDENSDSPLESGEDCKRRKPESRIPVTSLITNSPPQANFDARVGLVTPPSSTTEHNSLSDQGAISPTARRTAPIVRPSFSAKRNHIPRPLDVDALRRERQFSGPYSAIPLFSYKRSHSTMEKEDAESAVHAETSKDKHSPGPKHIHLPQITPTPYRWMPNLPHTSTHPIRKLPLPRFCTVRCGASPVHDQIRATPNPLDWFFRRPEMTNERIVSPVGAPTGLPTMSQPPGEHRIGGRPVAQVSVPSAAKQYERKMAFLNLCEQIWNVIQE